MHPDSIARCDDFVGRAPWPAADPLVGLLGRSKNSRLVAAVLPCGAGWNPAADWQSAFPSIPPHFAWMRRHPQFAPSPPAALY